MEDIIKNIIDRAKAMRTNSKITDYDIAQFVHIELVRLCIMIITIVQNLEMEKMKQSCLVLEKVIC